MRESRVGRFCIQNTWAYVKDSYLMLACLPIKRPWRSTKLLGHLIIYQNHSANAMQCHVKHLLYFYPIELGYLLYPTLNWRNDWLVWMSKLSFRIIFHNKFMRYIFVVFSSSRKFQRIVCAYKIIFVTIFFSFQQMT